MTQAATLRNTDTAPRAPIRALELRCITKRFGSIVALDDVSMSVDAGSIHCLIGENGAGKSTLCNIIFGLHRADSGTIQIHGNPARFDRPADALASGIAMVHQHFSVIGELTVAENLMLGPARLRLPKQAIREAMDEAGDRFGIKFDANRLVDDLTVGERQRLEILKCLLRDPTAVVLDEPTAVLPPHEIDDLLGTCRSLADDGRAILLVTHKLIEVTAISDSVTVLRAGRLAGSGATTDFDTGALVELMVGREASSLDPVLASALGITSDNDPAATDLPTFENGVRSVDRDDSSGRRKHGDAAESTKSSDREAAVISESAALVAAGITVRNGDRVLLDGVSLTLDSGEVVGVAGVEGNGQTELAHVLSGRIVAASGTVCVGGAEVTGSSPSEMTAAGVGVIPEDRLDEGCLEDLSIADNLLLSRIDLYTRLGFVQRAAMRKQADELMAAFDIRASDSDAPMRTLSGGNQQKVVLARELSLPQLRFLLAVHPTRGLDIGAVDAVSQRLSAASAAGIGVLVVSTELSELLAMCHRIVVLYRGRIAGDVQTSDQDARARVGALMAGHA